MPYAMDAFGCSTVTPSSGIIVGGHRHDMGVISTIYLFTSESQTLTKISALERNTKEKTCKKLKLSTGRPVVLCTLGIMSGNSVATGETYVYDIMAETFERKAEWDFPNSLVTGGYRSHSIDNRMLVQTPSGMFLFKDNETSTDTSSKLFKIGDWDLGYSAPFNLRYVVPEP